MRAYSSIGTSVYVYKYMMTVCLFNTSSLMLTPLKIMLVLLPLSLLYFLFLSLKHPKLIFLFVVVIEIVHLTF